MRKTEIFTGPTAYDDAKRKSRYGRRDWIFYKHAKTGEKVAELLTAESVKRALLAKGTKGKFTYFFAGGSKLLMGWRHGINLFMQMKHPVKED